MSKKFESLYDRMMAGGDVATLVEQTAADVAEFSEWISKHLNLDVADSANVANKFTTLSRDDFLVDSEILKISDVTSTLAGGDPGVEPDQMYTDLLSLFNMMISARTANPKTGSGISQEAKMSEIAGLLSSVPFEVVDTGKGGAKRLGFESKSAAQKAVGILKKAGMSVKGPDRDEDGFSIEVEAGHQDDDDEDDDNRNNKMKNGTKIKMGNKNGKVMKVNGNKITVKMDDEDEEKEVNMSSVEIV